MNKKNILILMTDQMQKRALYDSESITPCIDMIRNEGMTFQNAYTTNAVCSPARASLMTGLLPHNHGVLYVTQVVEDDVGCLREEKAHFASRLVDVGYETGYFGKWHVERTHDLKKYGWQVNFDSHTDSYLDKVEEKLGKRYIDKEKDLIIKKDIKANSQGYNDTLLYGVTSVKPEDRMLGITTQLACEFISGKKNSNNPWCCFVSFNEPHDPYVCGEEAFSLYDADNIYLPPNSKDTFENSPNLYKRAKKVFEAISDDDKKMAKCCYLASITEIDREYEKIVNVLKESNQYDDTIIIILTDHGELLGAHELYTKNISAYEEVYNIPLIIKGDGIKANSTSYARVGIHDVANTILDLAGASLIECEDSRSFKEVLDGVDGSEFEMGFSEYFGGEIDITQKIVWNKRYKYVFNGFDYDELYDLENDPYERCNLINEEKYKAIIKELCTYMWERIRKTTKNGKFKLTYPILRMMPYGQRIIE